MSRQADRAAAERALEEAGREALAALRPLLAVPADPGSRSHRELRAQAALLRRAADRVEAWADAAGRARRHGRRR